MKPIYIDNEFKCHTTNPDGTFREVVLSDSAKTFFADKCTAFIEGYRLKPDDEIWVREDGHVFSGGEMISPWKNYDLLEAAQVQYELMMAETEAVYREGVNSLD
jgi:hypothetical protein